METLALDHTPALAASWEASAYTGVRDWGRDRRGTLPFGGLQEQGNAPFFPYEKESIFFLAAEGWTK